MASLVRTTLYQIHHQERALHQSECKVVVKRGLVAGELIGIRPLCEVDFGDLPSHNGASPTCHYETQPTC